MPLLARPQLVLNLPSASHWQQQQEPLQINTQLAAQSFASTIELIDVVEALDALPTDAVSEFFIHRSQHSAEIKSFNALQSLWTRLSSKLCSDVLEEKLTETAIISAELHLLHESAHCLISTDRQVVLNLEGDEAHAFMQLLQLVSRQPLEDDCEEN